MINATHHPLQPRTPAPAHRPGFRGGEAFGCAADRVSLPQAIK